MAHKIILEKVSSDTSEEVRVARGVGGNLHIGTMFFGPVVGKSFSFFKDTGHISDGYMHTSEVKEIRYNGNILTLKTRNSTYKLTIGEEVEPK